MARLTIVVTVDADPTLEDPHEVAGDVTAEYNDWARANDERQVVFEQAEWGAEVPPQVEGALDHEMVGDPPPVLAGIERWSCVRCGRVVVRATGQKLYGAALIDRCDGGRPAL